MPVTPAIVGAVGAAVSYITELSVLVEAFVLLLPAKSRMRPIAILGITVPSPAMLAACNVKLSASTATMVHISTEALPEFVMSAAVKLAALTASLNSTSNTIGKLAVGSTCAAA